MNQLTGYSQGMNRMANPTGKGGFQDHPELINKNGAPKRNQTWSESIKRITDMTPEEAIKFVGPKTRIGRILKKFTPGLPIKDSLIFSSIIAYDRDPNAKMFQALTDREEGKPRQTIITANESKLLNGFTIPAELIAPDFFASHRAILSGKYTEFIEYGGRGSTKSSFISLEFISLLVNNPQMHGLATRQIKDTLRDSVYSQLLWAIDQLNLNESFRCTVSPMEIQYIPTGQTIFFRGADEPAKIKSIKPPFGYIGLVWFEELDSFYGPETIRNIEQSAVRGGDSAYVFKSYNPPRTVNAWVNKYINIPKDRQHKHSSDYLSVPADWLGKPWLDEAEHLKSVNFPAYEHEYLGVANGVGGMIFDNVIQRTITDEEIAQFDNVLRGGDWGFYPDPYSYGAMHYDAARLTLYIFDEYRDWKKSNRETYDYLVENKGLQPDDLIILDSAESKSVADYRDYGANARAAEKGKESRKYSYKWLQGLTAIVIDPKRAPYHAEEFSSAEYPRTKDGEIISEYPSKDDHAIDDTRYATNLIWRQRGQ